MKHFRHQIITTRGEFIAFLLGAVAAFSIESFHYEIVLCVLILIAPYEYLGDPARSLVRGIKRLAKWSAEEI